jgi:cobalt/nickel transport system permease protein
MKLEIDEYAHLRSPIHAWQPRYKLIGLLALIFAIATVENLWVLLVVVLLTAGLYALTGMPLHYWMRRLRYPGFFLLGVVFILPITSGETVLWQWGWLTLRQEGCLAVLLIGGRFLSIVTISLILFGTSPFLQTVKAMRSLGLPTVFTDMLLLSYRYLYEIAEQLGRMQQAMRLRGFNHHHRRSHGLPSFPNARTLRVLSTLAGTLLIRSYEQSERVYQAMRLRGYGSATCATHTRTKQQAQPLDRWSAIATGVSLSVAIAIAGVELWL